MSTKSSSREWLRVAALLVVFLSGLVLPCRGPLTGALAQTVSGDSTAQPVPFSQDWLNPRQVAAITSNRPSNLRDAEYAADFVIISHRNFLESVKPLQSLRESQGLRVAVVDVEDVYDEFDYGDKSPQAIKDFLAFAKTNWRTPPRFALLVGDASLDPKNYMGHGDYDFVPTRLIDTMLMETVSDEWLADFDGDGLAEMALGRLPVRTAGEASRIIDKIVSYESAPRNRNTLLASDLNDGIDFQSEFLQVAVLASSGMCDSGPQALLDQEMFRVIFAGEGSSGGALTLGEAVMRAKNPLNDSDVRLTYVLFGDPTTRVK